MKNMLKEAIEQIINNDVEVEIKLSNRPDLCDYQFDGAFSLAKKYQENPYVIGTKIATILQENTELSAKISKIECVKPGFINFTLKDSYINELLNQMHKQNKWNINIPETETIVIDYGGANVAKPLHVGHLRPAIVGEAIKRLCLYMNQKVIADVHLGDYGLQIGQVIYGLQAENISVEDLTLEKLTTIYPKMSALCKEDELIKEKCATITKELQDGNEEYQQYFHKIVEISLIDIKKMYDYLGVSFDLWLGESDAYPYIPEVAKMLQDQNLLQESNGAQVVDVSEKDDKIAIPPFIFQKSNKAYLYGTTDLATIYQRQLDYHPSKILYVADQRQRLHFTQVFRVSKKLEATKNINCEFLGLGTINDKDGKPFKTRAGNTPKLEELIKETKTIFLQDNTHENNYQEEDLDKIINAIIKYADLQNNREKEYSFDIAKFSSTTGKTGPYILYTYLRIKKVVENNQSYIDNLSKTIYNGHDRELRIKLLAFAENIEYAYKTYLPSVLANYVYEVCVLANAFYENNHINNLENEIAKKDWVTLLSKTAEMIKTLLDILGIDIPTKM